MTSTRDDAEGEVVLARFRYRHEAELAAGFLLDGGIPFRLQIDDAGGVDFGTTFSRPPVLWVLLTGGLCSSISCPTAFLLSW